MFDQNSYMREYRLKNNERLNKYRREYYRNNKESIKKTFKKYYKKNRIKLLENKRLYKIRVGYSNSLEGKYSEYKHEAKRRKINFNLSFNEFGQFWKKSCIYCGNSISTIGIDRIDSTIGYFVGNVVSCCAECNRIKNSKTLNNFLKHCEHCKAIWEFWGIKQK